MYMYASYLMLFRFLFPHAQIYTHWYQCTICILLRSSLPFQTFGMHVIQCSRNELNTAYMYITFSASCFKKFAISLKINKKERIYILANWYQYCFNFLDLVSYCLLDVQYSQTVYFNKKPILLSSFTGNFVLTHFMMMMMMPYNF